MVNFFRRGSAIDKNTKLQSNHGFGTFNKTTLLSRKTDMVPGAVANPYNNTSPSSNMAGYSSGAPSPMEGYHNSKHYSFNSNGQASPSSRSGYHVSRESRSTADPRRRSGGSTRSNSRSRSSPKVGSSGHNYSSPQNGGDNNSMQHQYRQPQAPLSNYEDESGVASVTPNPPDLANYPPHVSSSQSQGSSASRRPAYLLHRDLVIGKGSYGQVCIASRGESEGHISGGSGKRKKFACKCVVLRNDAKYIAKLQEEVNVLRELRGHENVICLYDVFCVDNELFIITELGRGGDLFHLLTTHPKHGVTEAYAGMFNFEFV